MKLDSLLRWYYKNKSKSIKRIYDKDGCTTEVCCPECGEGELLTKFATVNSPDDSEADTSAEVAYYQCNACDYTSNCLD